MLTHHESDAGPPSLGSRIAQTTGVASALICALAIAFQVGPARAQGSPSFGPGGVYANVPPIDDRGRDQLTMFNRWNPDPIGNEPRMLASVRPELAAVVGRARAMDPGIRFVVGSGLRSVAEQRQAEIWGWSPPKRPFSNPSLRKHIEGKAVDLWPLDEANRVTFSPALQTRIGVAMIRAARELGVPISWGGNWRGRKDPTHFELVR